VKVNLHEGGRKVSVYPIHSHVLQLTPDNIYCIHHSTSLCSELHETCDI
jgi:hypothetical protein